MQNSFLREIYSSDSVNFPHRHFHLCYELIAVLEGRVRLRINETEYPLSAGQLALIGAFEEHDIEVLSRTYRRYILTLDPPSFERAINDPRLISVFKTRPEGFAHCFALPPDGAALLQSMLEEQQHADAFSPALIADAMRRFLIQLYRQAPARFPSGEKAVSPELLAAQEYIDAHYAEELRIAAVAQAFHLSPCYFSHAFKTLTGYSPKRYLLLLRLSRAKELLIHTDLPVAEIALRCGFASSGSLIRAFRQELRITPNQYRHRS